MTDSKYYNYMLQTLLLCKQREKKEDVKIELEKYILETNIRWHEAILEEDPC